MSDTPRTDALISGLAAGTAAEVLQRNWVKPLMAHSRELERELAEAKRDAERYRWLKENATDIRWERCHVVRATMHCLDASIGAAMKEGKK